MRGNWTSEGGAQARRESLENNLRGKEMCLYRLFVCLCLEQSTKLGPLAQWALCPTLETRDFASIRLPLGDFEWGKQLVWGFPGRGHLVAWVLAGLQAMIVSVCSLPGLLMGAVMILFLPTSLFWVCSSSAALCFQLEESFCSKCYVGGVFPPLWKPCYSSWVLTLAIEGVFLDLMFSFFFLCILSSVLWMTNGFLRELDRARATYELGVSKLSWEYKSLLQLDLLPLYHKYQKLHKFKLVSRNRPKSRNIP